MAINRPTLVFAFFLRACILALGVALCCCAEGQVLFQDQEAHVHNLPSLTARSGEPSEILLASLASVFHDPTICCGKDSALQDSALATDPTSLKDVANKLEGRHLLSDGHPIQVTAEYLAGGPINSDHIISMILNQHAAIIEWNSELYVIHGVVYRWTASGDPSSGYTKTTLIRKFLLWNTRFSDSRREVVLDRDKDDWSKVEGLVFLQVARQ